MKYQDRDFLREMIVSVGGVEQALFKGLLCPQDMPDDEMRFQAKDLYSVKCFHVMATYPINEENPLRLSVKMFEHALAREQCERLNAGARWMMGEAPDER